MGINNIILLFLIIVSSSSSISNGHLIKPDHYCRSCPQVLPIVKAGVAKAIQREVRLAASILRLHFHDCFVNGCDASILLDDTPTFTGEKTAPPNNNSVRGFEVIDDIKAQLEAVCPGVVSCADILTLAARDATVYLGGPSWVVGLGRRDSRTANASLASANLPPPSFNVSDLVSNFARQGLSLRDMVALSGGHTIGLAKCSSFRPHIYNDNDIDPSFAQSLQQSCPRTGNDDLLKPLDRQTPNHFDNLYFKNLLVKKGLLHSDQVLFNGGAADSIVQTYASNPAIFYQDFATAMVKMGNIKLLTGNQGEIRKNCRRVN